MHRIFFALVTTIVFLGCSGNQGASDFDTNLDASAQELFDQALTLRERKKYEESSNAFLELERRYPLDPLAVEAQFARAVSFYEGQLYADAIKALDRFLTFNSGHPKEIQATYLRALSYYDEIPDVFRDQGVTRQAQVSLQDLIAKFPNSEEAKSARAKLVLVREQLAGHNMVIGRAYQKQNRYLAAQNRFKSVIEDYPKTNQVPEAFYRLVETSLALGLVNEARGYGTTLGHNFSDNIWYSRAYTLLTIE